MAGFFNDGHFPHRRYRPTGVLDNRYLPRRRFEPPAFVDVNIIPNPADGSLAVEGRTVEVQLYKYLPELRTAEPVSQKYRGQIRNSMCRVRFDEVPRKGILLLRVEGDVRAIDPRNSSLLLLQDMQVSRRELSTVYVAAYEHPRIRSVKIISRSAVSCELVRKVASEARLQLIARFPFHINYASTAEIAQNLEHEGFISASERRYVMQDLQMIVKSFAQSGALWSPFQTAAGHTDSIPGSLMAAGQQERYPTLSPTGGTSKSGVSMPAEHPTVDDCHEQLGHQDRLVSEMPDDVADFVRARNTEEHSPDSIVGNGYENSSKSQANQGARTLERSEAPLQSQAALSRSTNEAPAGEAAQVLRRYSTLSFSRMQTLDTIEKKLTKVENKIAGFKQAVDEDTASAPQLGIIADALAQSYGALEKLQYIEIDAVHTGDLNTGSADARALRKSLTRRTHSAMKQVEDLVGLVRSKKQRQNN